MTDWEGLVAKSALRGNSERPNLSSSHSCYLQKQMPSLMAHPFFLKMLILQIYHKCTELFNTIAPPLTSSPHHPHFISNSQLPFFCSYSSHNFVAIFVGLFTSSSGLTSPLTVTSARCTTFLFSSAINLANFACAALAMGKENTGTKGW